MAAFPCPFCGHAVDTEGDEAHRNCPNCGRDLVIAYRYRLVADRGAIAGGQLFQAMDDGLNRPVAVLFAADASDASTVARFLAGNQLFADLRGRGLVKLLEVSGDYEARPYVVMEWLGGGTLERRVSTHGVLEPSEGQVLLEELLVGLGTAHRAMPAVIHGSVDPSRIGFLEAGGGPVLFGFEAAEQIREQVSHLADSFDDDEDDDEPDAKAASHADLRGLGRSVYYALTGEWLGELPVEQQRTRALERAQLLGSLAGPIVGLLASGAGGYDSTVEAREDLAGFGRHASAKTFAQQGAAPVRQPPAPAPSWPTPAPDWQQAAPDWQQATSEAAASDDPFAEPLFETREEDAFEDALFEWPEPEEPALEQPATQPPVLAQPATQQPVFEQPAPRSSPPQHHQHLEYLRQQAQRPRPPQPKASPNSKKLFRLVFVISALAAAGMWFQQLVMRASDFSEEVAATAMPEPAPPEPMPEPVLPDPLLEPALPDPLPELVQARSWTGVATTSEWDGETEGPVDVPCDVWMTPHSEDELSCQWKIDCGTPRKRVYGFGDTGYTTCAFVEGKLLLAIDSETVSDAAFNFSDQNDRLEIELIDPFSEPPLELTIVLDPNSRTLNPGPAPEVDAIARADRETIAAAQANDGSIPAPEPGAPPDSETISRALQLGVDEMAGCTIEAGAQIAVRMTLESSGSIVAVELEPEPEPSSADCIRAALLGLEFAPFDDKPMVISWTLDMPAD